MFYYKIVNIATVNCTFDHKCLAYVAISHAHKSIVVAYRGSEDTDQALDVFTSFLIIPKTALIDNCTECGNVQQYFREGATKLYECIVGSIQTLIQVDYMTLSEVL
jgi:hypothetical protein